MASLVSTILDNLVAGAAKYTGNEAAAWVLNGILGAGGPTGDDLTTILSTLATVEGEITDLQTTITNFINLYQAETALQPLQTVIINAAYSSQTSITGDFKTFSALSSDDTSTAKTLADNALAQSDNLNAIAQVMTGPTLGLPDLMTAAANVQFTQMNLAGITTTDPVPLMTAYTNLENLFDAMFQVQVQGLALTVNGYNAQDENDLALAATSTFMTNLGVECGLFLSAVQSLAAGYHSDDTLVDMLIGGPAVDPIRAAQAYLNGLAVSLPPVPRVWIWSGSGAGFNMKQAVSAPSLTINSSGGAATANAISGPVFASSTSPWIAARYEYPAAAGTWTAATQSANAVVTSGPSAMPFDDSLTFSFDTAAGGNDGYIVMATIGTLATAQQGCLILPAANGDCTAEVWFYPSSSGTLFASYISPEAGSSITAWSVGYDAVNGWITLAINYLGYTDQARTNLVSGQWNHVAVVVDFEAMEINVITNGMLVMGPGVIQPEPNSPMQPNTFGASSYASGDVYGGISAAFNELRVWSRALQPGEIYANMYLALTSGDSLEAVYGFERGNVVARMGPPAGPIGSFTYPPLAQSSLGGWAAPAAQQHPQGEPPL